jgi:MOSC domain-containing protein YiiM
MKLLSVNVSKPKNIQTPGGTMRSGINKVPVEGRVRVGKLNLEGDGQADPKVHGGQEKAVYAYSAEHYPLWNRELGEKGLPFGWFGENLTVEGMAEEEVRIGDIFRIGTAVFQVSQPRTPCHKLEAKSGRSGFARRFVLSGRSGFYLRVLEEGEVGSGDGVERVRRDPVPLTIREVNALAYAERDEDLEALGRASRIESLSAGWRKRFQQRLARAGAGPVH